jgi:hypothetical protein
MKYILASLIFATLFGAFFGSEGQTDPHRVQSIFWGIIGAGALMSLLEILWENLCRICHCPFCPSPQTSLRR